MDAPLCDICEPPRRHWRHEPHKFDDPDKEFIFGGGTEWTSAEMGFVGPAERPIKVNKIAEFDRKAYQREYMREYMRKRRAEKPNR